MYPVYSPGPIMGARPLFMVDRATRDEFVQNGTAKSVNTGDAIQLLITLEQFRMLRFSAKIRGTSCQMGPRITEGAAFGDSVPYFKSIAEGWHHVMVGAYCPLQPANA